jgi:hypothetical protein
VVKRLRIFYLPLILLFLFSCKNPLEEEKKKDMVRDYYYTQAPVGRYIHYWDGKDEDGNFVATGKYIIVMEVKDFQDQINVTAIDGGKPSANDEGDFYFNEIYHDYELLVPDPDPFRVREGVNIAFIVGGAVASVKLSIYKD